MNIKPITVGADPEFFVCDHNGNLVSAHDFLPGTKDNPAPLRNGAKVQVDGIAAEINTIPMTSKSKFGSSLRATLNILEKSFLEPNGYRLLESQSVRIDEKLWDSLPDEVKELGCDPDYNAYTGEENPQPNADQRIRGAAGHIHIGWTEDMDPTDAEHFEACCMITRALDMVLGYPLKLLEPENDRAKQYGQAGSFRPKPYGCEYRVPSNYWVFHHRLNRFVYETAVATFNRLMKEPSFIEDNIFKGARILVKEQLNGHNDGPEPVVPMLSDIQSCESQQYIQQAMQHQDLEVSYV